MCTRNLTSAVAGLVACCVLLLGIAVSHAAVITPMAVSGTPSLIGSSHNLINGAGLSGVGDILTQTHDSTHLLGWYHTLDPANELVFEFAETADLTSLYAWQYEQSGGACCHGRGVNTFDVSFSTDNGASYGAPISLSLDSSLVVPDAETAQTRTFDLQTGVTNAKFTNMTDFPTLDSPGVVALNEVRFEGTSNATPFEPAEGSIAVGNALTPRAFDSDGMYGLFATNYEAMPADGTVDSVSIHYQGSNSTFDVYQLRPTGNPDEYEVVYNSGTIAPFGAVNQVESFPLPDGPIDVLAGDIFAHYGAGIPYSNAGEINADNPHPIFGLGAADDPQVGDLLTISDTEGSSTRGDFPVLSHLSRDYAMAVNVVVVPEPSTVALALTGLIALGLTTFSRRRR